VSYSAFRPSYPPELFSWLASIVLNRGVAWDAATGNGQAAVGLTVHFERVIATDRSSAQIRHAKAHPRIEYRVAKAETSGISDETVDLTVSAAALHWFDLPEFYREVERVSRVGAVVAAWSYHVAHVNPPFSEVFWPFYRDIVGPHFAAGARLVDDRYEGISLPGLRLDTPNFELVVRWTAPEIVAFIRTWSGVQSYKEETGEDPVDALVPALKRICGARDAVHEVRWPLYLRASRL
jgi:hypothetical protein